MDTTAKLLEEGQTSSAIQIRPSWIFKESLLSLSSKFPLIPGSEGSVIFCTTQLSEKLQQRPEDADFDLTDSVNFGLSTYNVLHDIHLKEYFKSPLMRRRLIEKGFITDDGYVKCDLMEFNAYRQWIRKVKLDSLHQGRRTQRTEEENKRREQHLQKQLMRDKDAYAIVRQRERRAKEMAEKAKEKREKDRRKYLEMQERDLERREAWKKEMKMEKDKKEDQREKQKEKHKHQKIFQEKKSRKIKIRFVQKRNEEDKRREATRKERKKSTKKLREKKAKEQWRRRCTVSLAHLERKHTDEVQQEKERQVNIQRRASIMERKAEKHQEILDKCLRTRRSSLYHEFFEADQFMRKLHEKKEKDLHEWRIKHERMRERKGSLSSSVGSQRTPDTSYTDMHLRRWSAPERTGFRSRLKSVWDVNSELLRDYEGEQFFPPGIKGLQVSLPSKNGRDIEEARVDFQDLTTPIIEEEEEEDLEEGSGTSLSYSSVESSPSESSISEKTSNQQQVRSLVSSIICNAFNVLEEEDKRVQVKCLVKQIIDSAQALVGTEDKKESEQSTRRQVRSYVLGIIESASLTLDREEEAKHVEPIVTRGEISAAAKDLVSSSIAYTKALLAEDIEKGYVSGKESDVEMIETAHGIVLSAIERAEDRLRRAQIEMLSPRMSAEEARTSSPVLWDREYGIESAAKGLVGEAIRSAVDSLANFHQEESALLEASTGLMNAAMITAKESLEACYGVTPILEEFIDRAAWRLANHAMISAQNSMDCLHEQHILNAAQTLASDAIVSAQTSLARIEERAFLDAAEELALEALLSARKSLQRVEEEDYFSKELSTRAVLAAQESLQKAQASVVKAQELAYAASKSAENIYEAGLALEGRNMATVTARRSVETLGTFQKARVTEEAKEVARLAVRSASESSLDGSESSHSIIDDEVMRKVVQFVENIIEAAVDKLKASGELLDLMSDTDEEHDYEVLTHEEAEIAEQEFVAGEDSEENKLFRNEQYQLRITKFINEVIENAIDVIKNESMNETPEAGRRHSFVHFSERNIFEGRRASYVPRESDFLSVLNRPPTPRYLSHRGRSPSTTEENLEELEKELDIIDDDENDSDVTGSIAKLQLERLANRRFSSDHTFEKTVTFQLPVSLSDSMVLRSRASHQNIVKAMMDSVPQKTGSRLASSAVPTEQGPCEFDTLVSVTNTPEPTSHHVSDIEKTDSISDLIARKEESVPCEISDRASPYVLLPRLLSPDKAKLSTKHEELEEKRKQMASPTHLPAVSSRTSLVMDQESLLKGVMEDNTSQIKPSSDQSTSNLPVISKSCSLISEKAISDPIDVKSTRSSQMEEQSSFASTEATEVSRKSSGRIAQVSPKTSAQAAMVSPVLSTIATKVTPKSSMSVTSKSTEISRVSLKPSTIATKTSPSAEAVKVSPKASTEAAKLSPAPSTVVTKVSPKLSAESANVPPETSTDSDKLSSKPSTEVAKVSPKPSTKAAKVSPKPSSATAKASPKTSTEEAKVSPKSSAKVSLKTFTEAAKVSPKSSAMAAKVSPKTSTEDTKVSPKPLTEAVKVSPETSTKAVKLSPKPSAEVIEVSPKPSVEASKVSSTPSTETAKVSRKPSAENANVSPKPSTEAAKVSPKPSAEVAKVSPKTSTEAAKVSPKPLAKFTKVSSKTSTEAAKVSPKPSAETAKVSPKTSIEAAKVSPKPSTEAATISPKPSTEAAKVSPKPSTEAAKVSPKPSTEAAEVSHKPSAEAATISPKPSTEAAKVSPKPSAKVAKVSPKTSTEAAKLSPKPSAETAKVSPKTSTEAAKVSPKPSAEAAKVSPKPSAKVAKVPPKTSTEAANLSPKPSAETAKVSPKTSTEAAKVSPKPSTEAAKVSPKPSAKVAKVSPKTSTEAAKLSPKPSAETAKVSPKTSTEAAKVSPKPSTEAAKVSPKPSAKVAKVSPKTSTEAAKLSPKPSAEAAKVSPKTSTEAAKVSPKPSSEAAKVSPKPSAKVAKVSPKTSTETANLSPKPSGEAVKVSPKTSTEAAKASPKPSAEVAKVSPKPSTEAAKVSRKTSTEAAKVSSKPLAEAATMSPKPSTEAAKVSPKPSAKVAKVSPKPSSEAAKVSPKLSTEAAKISPKPSAETAKVSPKTSTEAAKVSPKPSKVSPKTSGLAAELSPKQSIEAAKEPQTSIETADVSSKGSVEATKMSPKPSEKAVKVSPKPSGETAKVSSKPSADDAKVSPNGESTRVTPKASKEVPPNLSSTNVSPTQSTKATKVSPKTSAEILHKQTTMKTSSMPSAEAAKGSTKSSVETAKVSPKSSQETAKVSPKSSKEVLSEETVEVSLKPSTEKVSSKAFKETTKESSKEVTKALAKKSLEAAKVSPDLSFGSLETKQKSHSTTELAEEQFNTSSRERCFSLTSESDSRNRRISLTPPDPVVALKGVGRKSSLPKTSSFEERWPPRRSSQDLSQFDEAARRDTLQITSIKPLSPPRKSKGAFVEGDSADKLAEGSGSTGDGDVSNACVARDVPSIVVQEPTTPPNDDDMIDSLERERIIKELDNLTNAQKSEDKADGGDTSDKIAQQTNAVESKADIKESSETPSKQSIPRVGLEFSPHCSSESIINNRSSRTSVRSRRSKGSKGSIGNGGGPPLKSLSFELKGQGLGSPTDGIQSPSIVPSPPVVGSPKRSSEYVPLERMSSRKLAQVLSQGVIITPLQPSPPGTPKPKGTGSPRRSLLKITSSEEKVKETQSETSLASLKSGNQEILPHKASIAWMVDSVPSVRSVQLKPSPPRTPPTRPRSSPSKSRTEKVDAARMPSSSSSSEHDTGPLESPREDARH